jgi:hypothetical protein
VHVLSEPKPPSVYVFGRFVDLTGPAQTALVVQDCDLRSTPYDVRTDQIRPARQSFAADLYAGANGAKIEAAIDRAPAAWRPNLRALKRGLDAYLDTRRGAMPVKARCGLWRAGGVAFTVKPLFALALPDGRVEVVVPWWNKGTPPGEAARTAVLRIGQLVMEDVYAGGTPVLLDFHRGGRAFDRLVGPPSPLLDQWLTAQACAFAASLPSSWLPSAA